MKSVPRKFGRYLHNLAGWRHLAITLAVLVVVAVSAWTTEGLYFWLSCGLGVCLLAMAVIDWFEFILPDWGTFGLLVAGLAYGLFLSPYSITHHLFGMLFGGLFSFCIQFLYSKFRKREGLGWGDVKLLAAAGAWLGGAGILSLLIEASITALAVSYLMAAVRGRRVEMKQKLAYGPYLCGAFWITWLFGPLEFL